MSTSDFSEYRKGLTSPGDVHVLVSAGVGATYNKDTAPRGLYVNSDGTAVLTDSASTQITYNVKVGQILPVRPYAIDSTSTADIIALW